MTQNWRIEEDAGDYFGHQKKQLTLADRRPVIRRASDLVGPGIGQSATRITNFNHELAQYNGFYSALPGAANCPDFDEDPEDREAFMGWVVMDEEIGGIQMFWGMTTGNLWRRTFKRDPADPETIHWPPTWDQQAV